MMSTRSSEVSARTTGVFDQWDAFVAANKGVWKGTLSRHVPNGDMVTEMPTAAEVYMHACMCVCVCVCVYAVPNGDMVTEMPTAAEVHMHACMCVCVCAHV
jgi:hypothetical protein